MEKFVAHIHALKLTQTEVADQIGITQAAVSLLSRGKKTPTLAMAVTIARWSKGAVPVESWLPEGKGDIAAPTETATAAEVDAPSEDVCPAADFRGAA